MQQLNQWKNFIKPSILLFSFTVATSSQLVDSSECMTEIIYSKNHAFAVTAPEAWVLDNISGVSQELRAVFYPKRGK